MAPTVLVILHLSPVHPSLRPEVGGALAVPSCLLDAHSHMHPENPRSGPSFLHSELKPWTLTSVNHLSVHPPREKTDSGAPHFPGALLTLGGAALLPSYLPACFRAIGGDTLCISTASGGL